MVAWNFTDSFSEKAETWIEENYGVDIKVYTPPQEEIERWAEVAGKPIWDKWVQDMEAKGLPGQKVFDETLRLMQEYEEKYAK